MGRLFEHSSTSLVAELECGSASTVLGDGAIFVGVDGLEPTLRESDAIRSVGTWYGVGVKPSTCNGGGRDVQMEGLLRSQLQTTHEAPIVSVNVRRRYHERARRRRYHKFLHRPYHHAQPVQDIRGHSNFHPSVTAPSDRVPTYPSSSS
ncbi:uncharacterized protein HKW66_Vig0229710 [Vigna angularis]|uniref:Uncharacterized protein n=1 Tax=Phaseolus angularis TaxID=3914 RepID=A0A8T0KAR8_PHAAN|nr:uncharacterized protein HKW66_Vig0229710 [Vigna angularis]